jgi:hypothetical protein
MTHQRNAAPRALKIETGASMREPRIFAYGFDAAGFSTHREPVFLLSVGQIEFMNFLSPTSFEMADGVIIPQGIFEQIERKTSTFGAKTNVTVHKASMLERERQVFDCLRDGKWVCFLVGEILDEVSQGFHTEPIDDTDLCKRILNAFQMGRHDRYRLYIDKQPEVRTEAREFDLYLHKYGSPRTVYELPHHQPIEREVIAELDGKVVGVEFDRQLFFLPFETSDKNWPTALSVAKMVAGAITAYRRSRISDIPDWVDEFRFRSEEDLYLEINSLLEQVNRLESQVRSWKDYKGILTTTGSQLRNRIVAILESVFDFHVEVVADRKSAMVTDDNHRPILIFQSISTENDIERDFIDQIHAQRESQGLPKSLRAILFVNSDMASSDIRSRTEKGVAEEVVRYAAEQNVLIVRTIDLLFLMRQLERDSERKKKLMQVFLSPGGWLKTDRESHKTYV